MTINLLAIDLAKNVFQLHGNDEKGRCVLKKKIKRLELFNFIQLLPPCVIAMEACSGAHYWACRFQEAGHRVQLISPQHVKPFVKANKNDANDAEAIAEAASRPSMRFVPIKTNWQLELQALHRSRSLLITHRVALGNAIRAFLIEQGIALPEGKSALQNWLSSELLTSNLSESFKELIQTLYAEYLSLSQREALLLNKLEKIAKTDERAKRIQKIDGVGPLIATAMVASMGDPKHFKNGRQFSAWLGLVPKQHSSGGKQVLLGISKRGDSYLRSLLVHGARSVINAAKRGNAHRSDWILEKVRTRGPNKTAVAIANHNARVIWALIAKGEDFKEQKIA